LSGLSRVGSNKVSKDWDEVSGETRDPKT
jgi:hypothetical protein